MKTSEFTRIITAVVILAIVIGFKETMQGNPAFLAQALFFSMLIIGISILSKKWMASLFEMDVEHRLWTMSRWGWLKQNHLQSPLPTGIVFPLIASLFTKGTLKLMTLLTYETTARKTRAARSFGNYRYVTTTDWHNGLIGAAGVVGVLLLALMSYFFTQQSEVLVKMAIYYAFVSIIPFSDLDGSQIFFGSRILWGTLATVTTIFFLYALLLR